MTTLAHRYSFLWTLAVLGVLSCGHDPVTPQPPQATSITLSKSEIGLVALGVSERLDATVKDQNDSTMTGVSVTWTSSSEAVATVSNGLVTAQGRGSATITATVGSLSASASVKVGGFIVVVQNYGGGGHEAIDPLTGRVHSEERPVHTVTITVPWYLGNSGSGLCECQGPLTTHLIAQKQPNAWGLYDMHGNVAEWVQDWYSESYYSSSPPNDPPGPGTGSERVQRGGAYLWHADDARSAFRGRRAGPSSDGFRGSYGFRLARTL